MTTRWLFFFKVSFPVAYTNKTIPSYLIPENHDFKNYAYIRTSEEIHLVWGTWMTTDSSKPQNIYQETEHFRFVVVFEGISAPRI